MNNSSWSQTQRKDMEQSAAFEIGETGEYKDSQFMGAENQDGNGFSNRHRGSKDGTVTDKLPSQCKGPTNRRAPIIL